MRRLSQRQKLLAGAFGLVAVVWTLDVLSADAGPDLANAAPLAAASGETAALAADPPDLEAVIATLQLDRTTRAALPFDDIKRDLFAPTPLLEAALVPAEPTEPTRADPAEKAKTDDLPFSARHSLQGVLTGRVSLALIDGDLVRRGSVIDGYRLIELHRDYVAFERDGTRVILRVETVDRPKQPQEKPKTDDQTY